MGHTYKTIKRFVIDFTPAEKNVLFPTETRRISPKRKPRHVFRHFSRSKDENIPANFTE